jgi:curved DNA-binding protein
VANPYTVLGVPPGSSPEEIKAAFRKLAMEHHPDRHGGSDESKARFQEINAAYEELTKPKAEQPESGFPPGFDEQFARQFAQHFGAHPFFRPRNPDVTVVADLTIRQAFEGCEVEVLIDSLPGKPTYQVQIPRSVENGQRVVIHGAGAQVHANLPPGDLYIIVRVDLGAYGRQGQHLFRTVEVDALEAILGTSVTVETIEGKTISVTIPAGTQFGDRLRIPAHGMYFPNADVRGDFFVNVIVLVPRVLTEKHAGLVDRLRERVRDSEGEKVTSK